MNIIANVGMSNVDLFNTSVGTGYKDAVKNKVAGECTGAAVFEKTNQDGEVETVSAVKVDGKIYSGNSKVMANRVNELIGFLGDEIENGVKVAFTTVQCKEGDGVALMVIE